MSVYHPYTFLHSIMRSSCMAPCRLGFWILVPRPPVLVSRARSVLRVLLLRHASSSFEGLRYGCSHTPCLYAHLEAHMQLVFEKSLRLMRLTRIDIITTYSDCDWHLWINLLPMILLAPKVRRSLSEKSLLIQVVAGSLLVYSLVLS